MCLATGATTIRQPTWRGPTWPAQLNGSRQTMPVDGCAAIDRQGGSRSGQSSAPLVAGDMIDFRIPVVRKTKPGSSVR